MQYPGRSVTGGLAGGIVLLGLALAFIFGDFNLPVFFVALAFAALVGPLGSLNPRAIYGGVMGFFWLLILALFFLTGSWIWFIVGAAIMAILGTFIRPILAGLLGIGILGAASMANRQQTPYYQPPQQQPYQPPQPPYQQGYQPTPETYQEGNQQYPYPQQPQYPQAQNPPQFDQPQANYPQQLPPQQQ